MIIRHRQNVVDSVSTHIVVKGIVDKTRLHRLFREHCTLYEIRIRLGTSGAFQFNTLVLDFERANVFVKKGNGAKFFFDIADNHIHPRRVTLVVGVNIQLEQIVFLFFLVEKIQNGENAGAKEFREKVEHRVELVLE
jgi:hypothetical protein